MCRRARVRPDPLAVQPPEAEEDAEPDADEEAVPDEALVVVPEADDEAASPPPEPPPAPPVPLVSSPQPIEASEAANAIETTRIRTMLMCVMGKARASVQRLQAVCRPA